MITYQIIQKQFVNEWNNKLLDTNASYFQYPYYCAGYEYMPNSSCEYFTINLNETPIAFVSVLNVKIGFLKIGLVIRGPVVLEVNREQEIIVEQGILLVNNNNQPVKGFKLVKYNREELIADIPANSSVMINY